MRALQAEYFDQNYDLAAILDQRIEATKKAVQVCENDDQYGLLDTFRDSLRRLEQIKGRPIPKNVHRQIDLLREIQAHGSSDVGDILDVRDVSTEKEPGRVRPLTPEEMREVFGSERPTRRRADDLMFKVYQLIDRAEAVCFLVYHARSGEPIGWYFVGYTAD